MSTLTVKINEINELLRSFGINAVQKIDFGGQIRYGYRPQYVFDAVNQIISPDNWRYELIKEEIFEAQAVAEVRLFLKIDNDWLCKGSHKGQMQIVRGNVGDAQKGAITDAIQKCFSLVSIGSDAYRGLLGNIYNSTQPHSSQHKPQPASSPQPVQQPIPQPPVQTLLIPPESASSASLPKIAGIDYQHFDGFVVAVGSKLFDKKELLKSAGFKWNKEQKNWYKELTH
ncbi:MAG: hypothetical protein KJ990_02610 [Proteobacteria bacterium]|nr:hypothetical protein [Pseudomonadota bacterium]MBU1648003.1 hypothetical protein [Pseudomonadota bacterium]